MNYKKLYIEWADTLSIFGVEVLDYDLCGFSFLHENVRAIIYIKPTMSYKQKCFVLFHETGHLFTMSRYSFFDWANKSLSEKKANRYALKVLKYYGISAREYFNFQKSEQKKKREKSWREI